MTIDGIYFTAHRFGKLRSTMYDITKQFRPNALNNITIEEFSDCGCPEINMVLDNNNKVEFDKDKLTFVFHGLSIRSGYSITASYVNDGIKGKIQY